MQEQWAISVLDTHVNDISVGNPCLPKLLLEFRKVPVEIKMLYIYSQLANQELLRINN